MPDIDILIEMSDFYEVDLREILDGERKIEKMAKVVLVYFVLGIISLVIKTGMDFRGFLFSTKGKWNIMETYL